MTETQVGLWLILGIDYDCNWWHCYVRLPLVRRSVIAVPADSDSEGEAVEGVPRGEGPR